MNFSPFWRFTVAPERREKRRRQSRLFDACRAGNLAGIEAALATGLSPEERGARYTPLLAAVEGGSVAAVELLLRRGARVYAYGVPPSLRSPLRVAVQWEDMGMVERLLREYPRPRPIREAAAAFARAMLSGRESNEPDALELNGIFQEALGEAVMGNESAAIALRLIDHGADPYRVPFHGQITTVLHVAALRDRPDLLAAFLRSGLDPRAKDRAGRTVLQVALESQGRGLPEREATVGLLQDAVRRK